MDRGSDGTGERHQRQRGSRRIWKRHGLQPHRYRQIKLLNDPNFVDKLRDMVGDYVDPPAHAIVLSLDEKRQMQALNSTQPGLPLKKGRLGTMTHDYKRHGDHDPVCCAQRPRRTPTKSSPPSDEGHQALVRSIHNASGCLPAAAQRLAVNQGPGPQETVQKSSVTKQTSENNSRSRRPLSPTTAIAKKVIPEPIFVVAVPVALLVWFVPVKNARSQLRRRVVVTRVRSQASIPRALGRRLLGVRGEPAPQHVA